MRKFLIYSTLFTILGFVPLEFLLRQVANTYEYKYDWMQRNASEVEVLILGSSHTYFGIRPEYIDGKTFNLANVSQEYTQDLFLLEYWQDKYKQLKKIIVPVSYFSLFINSIEDGDEWYRLRYYQIYMDYNKNLLNPRYNFELSHWPSAKKKFDKLFQTFDYNIIPCDKWGWGSHYRLADKDRTNWDDIKTAIKRVEIHTTSNWKYVEENYTKLENIARFCKKHKIQLVLVTTPCWHLYYNNVNKKQLSIMYNLTQQLLKKYDLIYLDYFQDERFVADDFYDIDHLSDIGAIKFSKIINHDIKACMTK